MCRFCTQHGDGKTWYLQAENYIADLESDLARREFMVDFVQGFGRTRRRALVATELLDATPLLLKPAADAVRNRVHQRQQKHHFGQPVPIEDCERIFDFATSIVRLPCVCRTHAGKSERALCLAVTTRPNDAALAEAFAGFDSGPDVAGLERLSKEQALELLRDCERDGLMHSVWTFESPLIGAICNCDLSSGCMAMRMTMRHDIKVMWRGEFVATLAEETCTGCGACVERCPFDAIDAPEAKSAPAHLRVADCWGCGVCRSACRPGAITLRERSTVPEAAGTW
jgi:Na+-translocating ferredoxin:NAD+ oxidoreductase RNF subunit RnfB